MYTPGPWTAEPEEMSDGRGIAIVAPGEIVATILPEDGPADAQDYANARLIAAAPELLAALQRVAEIVTSGDNFSAEPFYGTEHAQIRALIAYVTEGDPRQ